MSERDVTYLRAILRSPWKAIWQFFRIRMDLAELCDLLNLAWANERQLRDEKHLLQLEVEELRKAKEVQLNKHAKMEDGMKTFLEFIRRTRNPGDDPKNAFQMLLANKR